MAFFLLDSQTDFYLRPYASEICSIYFQNTHHPLRIPRQLLSQSSTLAAKVKSEGGIPTLRLYGITYDAGHVLLHFLVTGTYQCLKPRGNTTENKDTSEFITAVRVYVTSASLGLLSLRTLARREIARVGDKLSFSSIIGIVENLAELFYNLDGLVGYVESRTVSFVANATRATADKLLTDIESSKTLRSVLLKSMMLLKLSQFPQCLGLSVEGDMAQEAEQCSETTATNGVSASGSPTGPILNLATALEFVRTTDLELAMKESEERGVMEYLHLAKESGHGLKFEEDELLRLQAKKGKLSEKNQRRLEILLDKCSARADALRAGQVEEPTFKGAKCLTKNAAIQETGRGSPEDEEAKMARLEEDLLALIHSRRHSYRALLQQDHTLRCLLYKRAGIRDEAQADPETEHQTTCPRSREQQKLVGPSLITPIHKGDSPPLRLGSGRDTSFEAARTTPSFGPNQFVVSGDRSTSSSTNGMVTPDSTQDFLSFMP
ncbi:hypothetical protein FDECE_8755 [Fusarium decemcellulare]|nr:hypothetical protein FDECE_8755 [Fusarium decemcellulare]